MSLAIAATARAILDATVAWYADPAREGQVTPLPPRRYVAAGDPRTVAWDDDAGQVTVAFSAAPLQPDPTLPGPVTQSGAGSGRRGVQLVRVGLFELQIVRPAPMPGYEGQPPGMAELDAHGVLTMADAEQVIAMVNANQQGGQFVPEGHGPTRVQVPLVETLGPEGGLVAIAAGIQIVLL